MHNIVVYYWNKYNKLSIDINAFNKTTRLWIHDQLGYVMKPSRCRRAQVIQLDFFLDGCLHQISCRFCFGCDLLWRLHVWPCCRFFEEPLELGVLFAVGKWQMPGHERACQTISHVEVACVELTPVRVVTQFEIGTVGSDVSLSFAMSDCIRTPLFWTFHGVGADGVNLQHASHMSQVGMSYLTQVRTLLSNASTYALMTEIAQGLFQCRQVCCRGLALTFVVQELFQCLVVVQ